ncbi:LysR substrate-binding domain-containing protein [Trinickia diaoshuihuensis]|uniref:LysR substrate-binding domain-containing protein n=1 Tax=Trinickia diaoshuihuensis TaxID=2292265 RepID=UPI001F07BC15|nr:LysR substrate-binding domain-containing protein [Trinickia diaoshuihuensis]
MPSTSGSGSVAKCGRLRRRRATGGSAAGARPRAAHKVSSTLSVLALTGAGLGVALAPAPLSRIAAPNVVYRTLGKSGPRSELVALSRIGGEWGAVARYLAMLGERAA